MVTIKIFNSIIKLFLAALLLCSTTACGRSVAGSTVENNQKIIAVSITPQAAFAEKVCGEKFEIVTMIPPGASPETYEPTTAEMQKLEKADIYFSIGVPSEENSILPSINENTEIIEMHTAVQKEYPDLEIDGGRDPHIWLSLKRAKIMVSVICDTVSRLDPENTGYYTANAQKYINELETLDNDIKSALAKNNSIEFLVFHPAFGYFADEYGLTMHALEEHGKEATAKQLAKMTELAKEKNIGVIFYQAEASARQAQAFAEEIEGKAVLLEPLAYNYTDNLKKMADAILEAME